MIRTLFSSSACCPLVRMAPTRSLSLLTSLQQDPYSLVLFRTTMRPWMMELPSLLRASFGRSDEEKGPMIDNAAMSRQLHASKVNMKKAGEELVKKAAVIRRKKSGTSMEQTGKENAAGKKNASEKAAAKKEAAKKIAAEKAASKKEAAKNAAGEKEASKKEATKKAAVKKAAAEKAIPKKEAVKKTAAEKASAKKALASAKKMANDEVAANKVGVMKSIKRKTTEKKVQEKTLQEVNVIEKTVPKDVKKVVKKDSEEKAVATVVAFDNVIENMMDPIQKLFLASIRAYRRNEGLAIAGDEAQDELKAELEKLASRHGFQAGEDATAFPELEFSDQPVDPIDIEQRVFELPIMKI